jgi:hypothetical protein
MSGFRVQTRVYTVKNRKIPVSPPPPPPAETQAELSTPEASDLPTQQRKIKQHGELQKVYTFTPTSAQLSKDVTF